MAQVNANNGTPASYVYHPDGRIQPVVPADGHEFSLKELQGFVKGCIEIVPQPHNLYLVVNDEGAINGMPFNPGISFIARQPIFGPALLCNRRFIS